MDDELVAHDSITIDVRAIDDRGVVAVTFLTDHASSGSCAAVAGDDYVCGPVPLVVGANTVLVRAFDAASNVASLVLRVRRAAPADVTPPTLTLLGLEDGAVVTGEVVVVTAVASDDVGVASVAFATDHGASGACAPAGDDIYPCGPVPLPLGDTVLSVTARDAAENAASVVLHVRRASPDRTPPTLTLSGVEEGATVTVSSIELVATATDDGGVASVRYATDHGDTDACGPPSGDAYPCGPIPLPLGSTQITVTARDHGGNATTAVRNVVREAIVPTSAYDVDLVFFDHLLTPTQMATFEAAAARWEDVVIEDVVDIAVALPANGSCGRGEPAYTGTIDDLVVFVTTFSEAPGGLLGYAGPCLLRSGGADGGLTAVGFMAFDALDLPGLQSSGALVDTITHELGHVLGFGTLWEFAPYHDLLDYVPVGASDCRSATGFVVPPTFTGTEANLAWNALGGSGALPVEDEGGPGTQCGHWDEATFGAELMTGWLNVGIPTPLSTVTVGSLDDLGYAVDASAADPYALPGLGSHVLGERLDLAGREILVAPRGVLDVTTGPPARVVPTMRHGSQPPGGP